MLAVAKIREFGRSARRMRRLRRRAFSSLIRDEHDRGVLVLCDPRVLSKPYGRQLLESLPPMRRTRAIADVEAFFAQRS